MIGHFIVQFLPWKRCSLHEYFINSSVNFSSRALFTFFHSFTRGVGDLIKRHIPPTNSIQSRHTHTLGQTDHTEESALLPTLHRH